MSASENKITWFERNPKKTLATIFIIGMLMLDFGAAAVLKTLGLFQPSYTNAKVLEATYRKQHPILHHTLAANIDFDQAEWGGRHYQIYTNSLGFKDSAVRTVSLETDKQRILFIGDSFTEGVGMEYHNTFVGMLDSTLSGKNIEVLNAGVSSYSPILYLRKIDYLLNNVGLKFDQVIAFIDLSDAEDEARGYTFDKERNVISRHSIKDIGAIAQKEEEQKGSFKQFMSDNTIMLGRLRNLAAWWRANMRPWDRAINKRRSLWTIDDSIYDDYAKEGLQLGAKHMTELKQSLDKHQIPITIAVYPWPDQIYHMDLNSKQVQHWQQWARNNNTNFINLFPAFINGKDPVETIKTHFIPGDVHWNDAGHALVANVLVDLVTLKQHKSK